MPWAPEAIPDEDRLYMRVHKKMCLQGLHTGIFREHGTGMSTDWEKYSTPDETRGRMGKPEDNGVIELIAGGVRAVEVSGTRPLTVTHTPLENPQPPALPNRAHSDVKGIAGAQKTAIRAKLFSLVAGWRIEPSAPIP